jgi:3-hydroxymyristoyl/3-hydroxydecanoyl-(acyl carrier protein) dehydratase
MISLNDVTANDGYYGEPHKMTLFQVGGVLMIQQVFKKTQFLMARASCLMIMYIFLQIERQECHESISIVDDTTCTSMVHVSYLVKIDFPTGQIADPR